jgi:pimeloyl-ACP methyl ester carboxylesterase
VNFLPAYRPSRLLVILLAAIATMAALIVSRQGAARATITTRAAVTTTTSGAKPTIVLVHGAWADGGSWAPVAERLQKPGYTVDIPPSTLRGVPQDSAYLKDFLTSISGPIVLVGHSYGGFLIRL